ncbi:hypothetical protein CPB84DRAFT_1783459 [Gymnopilus junonius]|uniref:Uncharacterized protein n=1 Tax=Gymnopilus junonius TaxID=109634 RepID=A0A9P5NKK7_GYMJU|nr:hypothetical protein CPB84DRAFT_1783459 [Gymnopilus junonius]
MALQTSHSAEPSSTSPASTETTTSNSGSTSSPFSAAGSPPLILAFLAVGLFSAAMIIVFGWRRIQFARALIPGGLPFVEDENSSTRMPLVRPKLWDLWNGGEVTWTQVAGNKKGGHDARLQWTNIMPLSANAVPSTAVPESIASMRSSSDPPRPSPRRDLLDRQPPALRLWRRLRQGGHYKQSVSPSTPQPRLQVEVAILMPSPRYPVYVSGKDNEYCEEKRKEREDITEYSIGVYECTWD